MHTSILIIPFQRNIRKPVPVHHPPQLQLSTLDDPPQSSHRSRFVHRQTARVLTEPDSSTTPFFIQGQKLVAESVTNVRPARCDLFTPTDTVSATLPIPARAPTRRLVASRCQADRTRKEDIIGGRDIRKCRRQLTALATQRRKIIERIQRTQRAWADDEWKSRTEVFIKTRGALL